MADRDDTSSSEGAPALIDLTVAPPLNSAELRGEVDRMVAEVAAATRRVAPLLREAASLLGQVDRMVVDYATAEGPGDADERYWTASRSTGHDQLFDALQALSVMADAYTVVQERHAAAAPAAVG